jgi:hypothetical protein
MLKLGFLQQRIATVLRRIHGFRCDREHFDLLRLLDLALFRLDRSLLLDLRCNLAASGAIKILKIDFRSRLIKNFIRAIVGNSFVSAEMWQPRCC